MTKINLQQWEKSERDTYDFLDMNHVGGSGKEEHVDKNNPDHIVEIKN